ncbi:uncharacterized protein LOC127966792 isoform X1 [Carassius gibelio]|uniref:uncharacterized protein LOC127966792 isoform X1 n=1 Tax=Carassius gibelio TaxID=101364 RepID=UPI002277DB25|nr:uncharacterized protein LOC127966792 isoform X1 [Carassius gibelio]
MAAPLGLHLEFGGGAELLFDGVKNHHVTLPGQSDPCSGLWASQAARYNDRYTTEEADSDPINLKQPLMLDPCLSLRGTPHSYKRTHLHVLVLTSLNASVLVETCPFESIV